MSGRVVDVAGHPIPQVNVLATALRFPSHTGTMTDAEGRYQLDRLPAGDYVIRARRENFVTLAHGQATPDQPPRIVRVGERAVVAGIDFIMPSANVVAGRVIDEYGDPIPRAKVFMAKTRWIGGMPSRVERPLSTETDDSGRFGLPRVPQGQYVLWVKSSLPPRNPLRRTGLQKPYTYPMTFFPGTDDPLLAKAISITVGSPRLDLEIALTPIQVSTINGSAIDSTGKPISEGWVSAVLSVDLTSESVIRGGALESLALTPIRPDGTFELTDVLPGDLELSIPDPSRPSQPVGVGADVVIMRPEVSSAKVRVSTEDVSGVMLTPIPFVTLKGHIELDGTPDADLSPNRIILNFAPMGSQGFQTNVNFEVSVPAEKLRMGAWVLSDLWTVIAVRIAGADVTDQELNLSDRSVETVEVEVTNRPPQVSGRVLGLDNEPVAAARVAIVAADRPDAPGWVRRRVVDAYNGRYSVRSLPPGRYRAIAVDIGSAIDDFDSQSLDAAIELAVSRAVPFTLVNHQTTTLDLKIDAAR